MPIGSPTALHLTKDQREKLATLGQRYNKAVDPIVTDDADSGYSVWDKWLNTVSSETYVCLDSTAGAADWQNISLDTADLSVLFDEKVSLTGDTMTGPLAAKIKTVTQPTTDTLTVPEVSGTQISNYGQGAENTQTLPAAEEGLNGVVVIGTAGAGALHLKAGGGDKIYLNGVALDDADKASLSTPAVGDYFTFESFKTGASDYDWMVISGQGTLSDGGA